MKDKRTRTYVKLFAARAKFLRTQKHWTQQAVAEASGLDHTTISLIERGVRLVGKKIEMKLFKGLGVTRMEFFDTDEFRAFEGTNQRPCLGEVCCRKCLETNESTIS